MFSGPSGAMALSLIIGTTIGLLDAAGFFITVRFFVRNSNKTARIFMVALELARLGLLLAAIVYLVRVAHLNTIILISAALVVSLAGKAVFALKGNVSHGSP